jgi:hypothetical protein
MTEPTPRTDHYRAEFKRRKETSDLIEWMLDEFAQEERRLHAKEAECKAMREAIGQALKLSETSSCGFCLSVRIKLLEQALNERKET